MHLWWVYLDNPDLGVYVIAPTKRRAKYIFCRCSSDICKYSDVNVQMLKPADGFHERYLDHDCQELKALGVGFSK